MLFGKQQLGNNFLAIIGKILYLNHVDDIFELCIPYCQKQVLSHQKFFDITGRILDTNFAMTFHLEAFKAEPLYLVADPNDVTVD